MAHCASVQGQSSGLVAVTASLPARAFARLILPMWTQPKSPSTPAAAPRGSTIGASRKVRYVGAYMHFVYKGAQTASLCTSRQSLPWRSPPHQTAVCSKRHPWSQLRGIRARLSSAPALQRQVRRIARFFRNVRSRVQPPRTRQNCVYCCSQDSPGDGGPWPSTKRLAMLREHSPPQVRVGFTPDFDSARL